MVSSYPHLFLRLSVIASVALIGCQETESLTGDISGENARSVCIVPASSFADGGVPKDGIPALTDPEVVGPQDITYLDPGSRVIGIVVDGQPLAVPHNILWSHEIVNLTAAERNLAVTYCPLTGSSMAFDRANAGGAEMGVSGLLFMNNLTMYDRNDSESLWPQMMGTAVCGNRVSTRLEQVAIVEMSWAGWQDLHPSTRVVSSNTGHRRVYTQDGYPYGDYEREDNARLLFSQAIDRRRPPKERLLGIPVATGGIAFPFGELDRQPVTAVNVTVDGRSIGVVWSRDHDAAVAFETDVGSETLSLTVRSGEIVDERTGSTWGLDGRALTGPLAGTKLEPVVNAYVAFWFAWAAFQPETKIWTAGQS